MIEFEGRRKIDTHLNIAPLIDVVFQLLIFFALSSQFIAPSGIKITLPAAASAKSQEQNTTIFITQDNNLYLDQEQVDLETLFEKLKINMLKPEKKKSLVISADQNVGLGLAVKVMDIAKQAGIDELTISTKEKDAQ